MKNILTLTVILLALTGCSDNKNKLPENAFNSTNSISQISSWAPLAKNQTQPVIQIVNQYNQPISDAKVLIGTAEGSPFKNNLFRSDKNGYIQNLNDWTTTEHVTADAKGFVRQTLLNQPPGLITIKLNPAYFVTTATISGQVTQLPVVNGDKNIDFGIVMSALTRSDFLNFDLGAVLSPVTDIMKVASYSVPVPTNVSLPTQKESYLFNLTIEKPQYRFFSQTLGARRLFAAAGRFPFKAVVDELRAGKPFYDVINYFDLHGGGIRDVTITNPTTSLDIPGNEFNFTLPITIASPSLNADEVFVALSASEVSGYLIPTGLKKMASNTTATLNALDNKPTFIVNVIKKQSEFSAQTPGADRLSAALLPYKANAKPSMLPLINDPSVIDSNGYIIKMPTVTAVTGIFHLAVSAVISDIQVSGSADKSSTSLIRKWEVLGTKWPSEIQLPNWPLDTTNKKHFEINFIGGTKEQNVNLGDELLKAATHVTHSSSDF